MCMKGNHREILAARHGPLLDLPVGPFHAHPPGLLIHHNAHPAPLAVVEEEGVEAAVGVVEVAFPQYRRPMSSLPGKRIPEAQSLCLKMLKSPRRQLPTRMLIFK